MSKLDVLKALSVFPPPAPGGKSEWVAAPEIPARFLYVLQLEGFIERRPRSFEWRLTPKGHFEKAVTLPLIEQARLGAFSASQSSQPKPL